MLSRRSARFVRDARRRRPVWYAGQGGHFLFTSLHKWTSAASITSAGEPMVLMYGVGWFRCSDVYLAMVPQHDFKTLTNVRFYMGADATGAPVWSGPTNWTVASDAAAQPLMIDEAASGEPAALPSIGNISVSFVKQLGLWLMTYDSGADGGRSVYSGTPRSHGGPGTAGRLRSSTIPAATAASEPSSPISPKTRRPTPVRRRCRRTRPFRRWPDRRGR